MCDSHSCSDLLSAFLGKIAPDDSSILMSTLFQDDSSDSEDLADELDDFFASRFETFFYPREITEIILTDEELESSISASGLLAVSDDFDYVPYACMVLRSLLNSK